MKEVYGNVRVNKESVLFLSIPYDKNWTVYVNGKKSSYEKVVDKFMGIRLKKGSYQIKMVYHPKQFDLGLLISISSIICLIYMSYKRRI
ncbi:MAG: YfhO family protein [Bacilli bacterium]|nr:YfhO family protein [Bacilli bacterium]